MSDVLDADRLYIVRNTKVIQTYVVQDRDGRCHYEIHLGPDAERDVPRIVLVTREEQLYELALAVEGNEHARVTASWHFARRGSHRVSVLDVLDVVSC
jgi:hypothetical protein